jgi:hypothetical protein
VTKIPDRTIAEKKDFFPRDHSTMHRSVVPGCVMSRPRNMVAGAWGKATHLMADRMQREGIQKGARDLLSPTKPTSYLPPPPIMPSNHESIKGLIHPLGKSPHDLWNGHHRYSQGCVLLIS